jgi:2-succinyl-6-hydroxy-2,4-cyclohexadiene-1-carboxylate synthase
MKIWALSGFLGLPHDWDFLGWKNLVAVDWQAFSWNSLPEWGRVFNHWVKEQSQSPKVLMGYSFGGRLALHALIDQPYLWQAAIIISAHIGLSNLEECQKRQQQDQMWAKRFESEDWISLMRAWNLQEIFSQDLISFERQEHNYQRFQLVKALIQGSLGRQADLCQQIASLPMPILWVTGSKDHRYSQIAQTLSFAHPNSQWKQIELAGHRVPWAQPQIFSQLIQSFCINNA